VTASTAAGSVSATSAFVSVPAGGLGTISETAVGVPRAGRYAVAVPLTCSAQAAGRCTIALRLSVLETLSGNRVVALAAAAAGSTTTRRVTLTVGARTVRLSPRQRYTASVTLNASGRRLLAHAHRLAVRLTVSGTVVGAIGASLKSATLVFGAAKKAASRSGTGSAAATRGVRVTRAALDALGAAAGDRAPTLRSTRHDAHLAGNAAPAAVLAPTPYMGWDTYFTFGGHFDEASVLEQASQLLTRGLARAGYRYVWLDAGWWQGAREASGAISVDPAQWPHGMAWLARTLHAAGFRVGLYTDAGSTGCGGPTGSYGHYQQDVNTFAAWGFDAIKVDFCGGVRMGLQPAAAYAAFHEAIVHNASHRPLLLSICNFLQPGQFAPEDPTPEGSAFASYTFGPSSGNSWRTNTDLGVPGDVRFTNVLANLDADAAQPQAAGPGHWNDPDYLGPDQGMSAAQFRTQQSMWAMLAAPLMVSADLITLSSASQATIANGEAIAIDQDPAGVRARPLATSGEAQVWVKPLSDGSRAIALLNRGSGTLRIATTAVAAGMPAAGTYAIRNVWSGARTSVRSPGAIAANVPSDSTVLLRVFRR
jgi:Alpha galactosidase A/Alpha galactosidase C-terminal beta sandwich domain